MNLLMNRFLLAFSLLLAMGCATKYNLIEPLTLDFGAPPATLADSDVEIAWRYDVLNNAGNRSYAQKELRNRVSLLAVLIKNPSADTLYFPENFLILSKMDTLSVLTMEESYYALCQDVVEKPMGENGGFELDAPWINFFGGAYNLVTEVKANTRFVKELNTYYLLPSVIAPRETVVGLIGLPVKQGTPLRFVVSHGR